MELIYVWDLKGTVAAVLVMFIVAGYAFRPMIRRPEQIRTVNRATIACMALLVLIGYLRLLELIEFWG